MTSITNYLGNRRSKSSTRVGENEEGKLIVGLVLDAPASLLLQMLLCVHVPHATMLLSGAVGMFSGAGKLSSLISTVPWISTMSSASGPIVVVREINIVVLMSSSGSISATTSSSSFVSCVGVTGTVLLSKYRRLADLLHQRYNTVRRNISQEIAHGCR
jgi:hypothetical protein